MLRQNPEFNIRLTAASNVTAGSVQCSLHEDDSAALLHTLNRASWS